jgi:hypothetical protein
MDRRLLLLIVVVGVAVAAVSGLANAIGIGSDTGTFGWKQIVGLIVGALIALGGLAMLMRGEPGPPPEG